MTAMNDVSGSALFGQGIPTIAPFTNLTAAALGNICRIYDALTPDRTTLGVLFSLDAAQTDPTEQWVTYFVETASAQLLWDRRPTGTLSEDDATWTLARFDEGPTLATMAVLVRLVEEAQSLPVRFTAEVRQRAELFGRTLCRGGRVAPSRPHLRLVA